MTSDADSLEKTRELFARLVAVVAQLRNPVGGCPWDLEQTHESLRPYVVEETYEVLEAIDSGDDQELAKELGDLLLQVLIHAQVAKDRQAFTIDDVIASITEKMIRRHPHVFGETKVAGTHDVLRNWELIKHAERAEKQREQAGGVTSGTPEQASMLAGVPKAMPALLRAQRLGQKAAKVSFDWDAIPGVWAKVNEEQSELAAEMANVSTSAALDENHRQRLQHELGDLLFALCQLSRWLDFSAEDALRSCCQRFIERFHQMEKNAGKSLAELDADQLEELWQAAKRQLG